MAAKLPLSVFEIGVYTGRGGAYSVCHLGNSKHILYCCVATSANCVRRLFFSVKKAAVNFPLSVEWICF